MRFDSAISKCDEGILPRFGLESGTVNESFWIWPLALFALTFVLGIVAVVAGIGGGVLFVPIVASFFPFHLDFVRGATKDETRAGGAIHAGADIDPSLLRPV